MSAVDTFVRTYVAVLSEPCEVCLEGPFPNPEHKHSLEDEAVNLLTALRRAGLRVVRAEDAS